MAMVSSAGIHEDTAILCLHSFILRFSPMAMG